MSVIFQSLQKLETEPDAPHPVPEEAAPEHRTAGMNVYIWIKPIVLGFVLVVALGCGAVYAVQYLKERLPAEEPGRAAPLPAAHHETSSPVSESIKIQQSVEAPIEPEGALQAPEPIGDEKALTFHPPEAVAVIQPKLNMPPSTQPAGAGASPDAPPLKEPVGAPVVAKVEPSVDEQRHMAEVARRAVIEKNARIGRLVRQVEQALATGADKERMEPLLKALAKVKGVDHPYVLKIRGYWLFKRGDLKRAEKEFRKVLSTNPEDLEAGINLVLIEIEQQKSAEAMKRLKGLRRIYPENQTVADLIKELRWSSRGDPQIN